jgi:hypothetical protein
MRTNQQPHEHAQGACGGHTGGGEAHNHGRWARAPPRRCDPAALPKSCLQSPVRRKKR